MSISVPETFYFRINLRFRAIIFLVILLCNSQKCPIHLRLNFCSGENSPVGKNGPTREQSPEDETGKWKLMKAVSVYFLNQPMFKNLTLSNFFLCILSSFSLRKTFAFRPEKFHSDDVAVQRAVWVYDWLSHPGENSKLSYNQSETLHGFLYSYVITLEFLTTSWTSLEWKN